MSYRASEAYDLDMQEAPTFEPAPQRRARRSLDVVEGGHLDAEVRQGVSAAFVSRTRLVVIAVVVFCALGAVRVALTAQTVALMSSNLSLSSQIDEASALNDELHAERSLLSSSSRIKRIATENYGMVYGPAASDSAADEDGQQSGDDQQPEVDEQPEAEQPEADGQAEAEQSDTDQQPVTAQPGSGQQAEPDQAGADATSADVAQGAD